MDQHHDREGTGAEGAHEATAAARAVVPMIPGPRRPSRPRPVRDAARAEIVLRHARLRSDGGPQFCRPTRAEAAGLVPRRQGTRTDGKVIYPDRDAAELAAREFEGLGAMPMRAYRCNRSNRGHFHLTRDTAALARRYDLGARIPQQRTGSGRPATTVSPAIPRPRDHATPRYDIPQQRSA